MPFIQNDICPSTDNLAPGDFFPEAQKSPDPLLPSPSAQTDWSTDRLCRLDLSGAPAQFQPAIRPEGPEAEVTPCLSGRLNNPDGLRPPSACRLPTGPGSGGNVPPQWTAERLDGTGCLRSSLCRPIRPEGLETGHHPPLRTAGQCEAISRPSPLTVCPGNLGGGDASLQAERLSCADCLHPLSAGGPPRVSGDEDVTLPSEAPKLCQLSPAPRHSCPDAAGHIQHLRLPPALLCRAPSPNGLGEKEKAPRFSGAPWLCRLSCPIRRAQS